MGRARLLFATGRCSYTYLVRTNLFLNKFFGDRLARKGLWPPWNPDLTLLDSFLWNYLKNSVYETGPASISELKDRIMEQIAQIDHKMLKHFFANLIKHVRLCKTENGGNF